MSERGYGKTERGNGCSDKLEMGGEGVKYIGICANEWCVVLLHEYPTNDRSQLLTPTKVLMDFSILMKS